MILICHLLVGAAIASNIQFAHLALFLAFLSHYFLDAMPHWEYSTKNIKKKQWEKSSRDFLKISLDAGAGILLIFMFSRNQPIIYAGACLACLADVLIVLYLIFPNKLLKIHHGFHEKMHFPKDKKFPIFWKIFTAVSISLISILFLL